MTAPDEKVVRLEPEGVLRPAPAPRRKRWLKLVLVVGVPLAAGAAALALFLNGGRYETTDDARLKAARVNVSSNVSGRVVEIQVQDNQRVTKDQVLFRLDPAPFDAAVNEARAALAEARLQVATARSAFGPRSAELQAARDELAFQEREAERLRVLAERGIAPRRDYDVRVNEVAAARGRVGVAEAALREAVVAAGGQASAQSGSHPAVQAAEAALAKALLDRSYTEIRAPQAGVVTRVEQLQVGSTITAAQPLYSLVADRVWIEANFRESQLAHLKAGQSGLVMIDALPGVKTPVRLGSLSPGAASVFALLPAENASGNFVKVTQRLPVRVEFTTPVDPERYRAGLSAKVRIDTGYRRTWSDLFLPISSWLW